MRGKGYVTMLLHSNLPCVFNLATPHFELSQQEAIDLDCKKVAAEEKASSEKLNRILSMNAKLDTAVAPLRSAASKLKSEQQRAKAELTKASFGADIQKVVELTGRMAQEGEKMQVNYKAAMEDRKKLHNLVLDLKGNIRVFVRCRPINAKELPGEPDGEATVSMSEQIKIGVYDGSHARRKWFEFDQAFDPSTTQSAVFEEAKPLATSVLDGYNVCVFAYGQTGSGKTHTMAGTQADPGLNTRVLTELFRIREERAGESMSQHTHMWLSCILNTRLALARDSGTPVVCSPDGFRLLFWPLWSHVSCVVPDVFCDVHQRCSDAACVRCWFSHLLVRTRIALQVVRIVVAFSWASDALFVCGTLFSNSASHFFELLAPISKFGHTTLGQKNAPHFGNENQDPELVRGELATDQRTAVARTGFWWHRNDAASNRTVLPILRIPELCFPKVIG